MEFSGERLVPGEDDGLLGLEHRKRYAFAARFVKGKTVLDIACGTGYGTRMLLDAGAAAATGVDISADAVAYARREFGAGNIAFLAADAETCKSGAYDVIVSFETLEHLENRNGFIRNLSSLLHENGLLIISTPNKAVTSPMKPAHKIRNKYHKYEYVEREFVSLLQSAGFRTIKKFGQHRYPAIFEVQWISRLFRRWIRDREETAEVEPLKKGTIPRYFVFVASK